jgi:hypothetical protein
MKGEGINTICNGNLKVTDLEVYLVEGMINSVNQNLFIFLLSIHIIITSDFDKKKIKNRNKQKQKRYVLFSSNF